MLFALPKSHRRELCAGAEDHAWHLQRLHWRELEATCDDQGYVHCWKMKSLYSLLEVYRRQNA